MATSGFGGGVVPSTSKKRKRVVLTIEKKLALDCLKKGSTQEKFAHEFGVGRFATTMDGLGASSEKRTHYFLFYRFSSK